MRLSRVEHLADGVGADAPHVAAEAAELCQHLDRRRRVAALLQVVADERLGGAIDVCTGTARLERVALTEADGSSRWVLSSWETIMPVVTPLQTDLHSCKVPLLTEMDLRSLGSQGCQQSLHELHGWY